MTQPANTSACAICGDRAQFTDADPGANPVSYCAKHLPEHLRGRAEAGQMPLQDGATVEELQREAKKLEIEGRSTMTKAQLQTAIAAAKATDMAHDRNSRVDPRDPAVRPDPDPRPVRLTPEAEAVEQQYVADDDQPELEGGTMGDAPVEVPEVHDHAVATAAEDEPKKLPTRRGPRRK